MVASLPSPSYHNPSKCVRKRNQLNNASILTEMENAEKTEHVNESIVKHHARSQSPSIYIIYIDDNLFTAFVAPGRRDERIKALILVKSFATTHTTQHTLEKKISRTRRLVHFLVTPTKNA